MDAAVVVGWNSEESILPIIEEQECTCLSLLDSLGAEIVKSEISPLITVRNQIHKGKVPPKMEAVTCSLLKTF